MMFCNCKTMGANNASKMTASNVSNRLLLESNVKPYESTVRRQRDEYLMKTTYQLSMLFECPQRIKTH